MIKIKYLFGIVLSVVLIFFVIRLIRLKDDFYADGGFIRNYLESPIDSYIEIPLNIDATYFVTSNNDAVVYIVGKKKVIKFEQIIDSSDDYFKIDTIPNHFVMANVNYFADDKLHSLYVQNLNSNKIQIIDYDTDSINVKIKNSSIQQISNLDIPVVFYNGTLICFKKSQNKWNYILSDGHNTSSFIKNKLSEQGNLRYIKNEKQYIYVSLFSNEILKLDNKFNDLIVGNTIDTITTLPFTKEVGNSYQFASPPRITNSDVLVNNKYLWIHSLVNADNDKSIKDRIIFDLYNLENLKYFKSISIDNPSDEQPLGFHLLHNNTVLLLYEKSIFVYKVKV